MRLVVDAFRRRQKFVEELINALILSVQLPQLRELLLIEKNFSRDVDFVCLWIEQTIFEVAVTAN